MDGIGGAEPFLFLGEAFEKRVGVTNSLPRIGLFGFGGEERAFNGFAEGTDRLIGTTPNEVRGITEELLSEIAFLFGLSGMAGTSKGEDRTWKGLGVIGTLLDAEGSTTKGVSLG